MSEETKERLATFNQEHALETLEEFEEAFHNEFPDGTIEFLQDNAARMVVGDVVCTFKSM